MRLSALLLLAACTRKVPPHLRVDPAPDTPTQDSTATTLAALVGSDPLLRRPPPGDPHAWARTPGGAPIAAWSALAARSNASAADWMELEQRWPATVAVPLARGARLATLEVVLASGTDAKTRARAAAWLAEVRAPSLDTGPGPAASPLFWADGPSGALHIAERSVLLGWLAAPAIDVSVASTAMRPGVHDRLIDSPAGQLLQARAAARSHPTNGAQGRALLDRATALALQEVAADRDSEQTAWLAKRDQVAAEINAERNPIDALLAQAFALLTTDAAHDASAGAALVALQAQRIRGTCKGGSCGGLDRNAGLTLAADWHPDVRTPAATWQLIALKRSIDRLQASSGRPSWYLHLPGLFDALLAHGGAVDLRVLMRQIPTGASWLEISRAAGGPDATDEDGAHRALNGALKRAIAATRALPVPPAQLPWIDRIAR